MPEGLAVFGRNAHPLQGGLPGKFNKNHKMKIIEKHSQEKMFSKTKIATLQGGQGHAEFLRSQGAMVCRADKSLQRDGPRRQYRRDHH